MFLFIAFAAYFILIPAISPSSWSPPPYIIIHQEPSLVSPHIKSSSIAMTASLVKSKGGGEGYNSPPTYHGLWLQLGEVGAIVCSWVQSARSILSITAVLGRPLSLSRLCNAKTHQDAISGWSQKLVKIETKPQNMSDIVQVCLFYGLGRRGSQYRRSTVAMAQTQSQEEGRGGGEQPSTTQKKGFQPRWKAFFLSSRPFLDLWRMLEQKLGQKKACNRSYWMVWNLFFLFGGEKPLMTTCAAFDLILVWSNADPMKGTPRPVNYS